MRLHPALSMSLVWLLCVAGYGLLPFHLVNRELTWTGGLMQLILIAGFCVGSLVTSSLRASPTGESAEAPDTAVAQRLLMAVASIAIIGLLIDTFGRNIFDLAASYTTRSDTANALLKGEASESSAWFQVAFVTYPAAYVFTGLHLLYAPRIRPLLLAVFGFAPFVMAGMVMGGRMPIFYGLLVAWLAYRHRQRTMARVNAPLEPAWNRRLTSAMRIVLGGAALYYFAEVFLVRAEAAGGAEAMFDIASERWGIGFSGPMADTMFRLLGPELSYLIFIFVWYVVQGLVMGNHLLFAYAEPAQWGAYGIDLFSALLRRLDPEQLASGFDTLMELGTYGFFPSAWGSLFVDLRYAALPAAIAWGAIAGISYKRIVIDRRMDWQLVGPFISIGILCSTINTPMGFTNGMVTHFWLLIAFLALRRRPASVPAESDAIDVAVP